MSFVCCTIGIDVAQREVGTAAPGDRLAIVRRPLPGPSRVTVTAMRTSVMAVKYASIASGRVAKLDATHDAVLGRVELLARVRAHRRESVQEHVGADEMDLAQTVDGHHVEAVDGLLRLHVRLLVPLPRRAATARPHGMQHQEQENRPDEGISARRHGGCVGTVWG